MAGDWIKMRGNLWDDPRVGKLCDLTDSSEACVIGALYWLWATADQHTEDGQMPGLTLRQIDRKTGLQGFADALVKIGWLSADNDGVRIIKFEEHNGASAKKRCQTAKRVANFKAGNAEVTQHALANEHECVSSALPREEKRREDKNLSTTTEVIAAAKAPAQRKGKRLPDDWKLPRAWGQWAVEDRRWPPEKIRLEGEKFSDYWRAKSGKDAAKLDWEATWRNWCRNANTIGTGGGLSFKERDHNLACERVRQMTGGLANAQPINHSPPPFIQLSTHDDPFTIERD